MQIDSIPAASLFHGWEVAGNGQRVGVPGNGWRVAGNGWQMVGTDG